MTPSELCDFLNNHAEITMPGWGIKFLPAAQQPRTVVSYIEISEHIAFGVEEASRIGKYGLKCLFREKTNDILSSLAQKAMDSKIR